VLAGVFDDNSPGGPFADDSQVRGAEQSGTKFNTGTGALFIAEIQYAFNPPLSGVPQTGAPPPSQPVTQLPPPGLPGVYKLGAYVDTGDYPDQRFDPTGLSLADPASNGHPRMLRGNFGIYGVMDQTVWRPDPQGARAVGVFARIMGGPGDRNLLNFTVNAGITLKSPLPGRDNDTLGLGYGLVRISGAASGLNQDRIEFSGSSIPVRSSESFIELTYQAQIAPWWIVQPDLQYVFTPGGGIANPLRPGQRVGNELVLGARTVITF
jgi:porin